ncbi:MAG: hypothetical protein JSS27_07780 [Planctomycetes bacterium]|nr:hypothetical protein [Planctomycetota bacterium]
MKNAVLGFVLGVGLVGLVAAGFPGVSSAVATPAGSVTSGDLITFTVPTGEHRQQLLLVDPRQRVVGVYHVDGTSGQVTLKCVRNVYYDLQLSEFNGAAPTPREIRSLVEPR